MLDASRAPTIRQRLEAIIALANGIYTTTDKPVTSIRAEAVAALDLMDKASRGLGEWTYYVGPETRLIPDPVDAP